MPTPPLPDKFLAEIAEIIAQHGGNVRKAATAEAASLNLTIGGFESRAKVAMQKGFWNREQLPLARPSQAAAAPKIPTAPELPDDDIPTADLIQMLQRRVQKRIEHVTAKRWRRFDVPIDGPYALLLMGDPHIDDNGCDWNILSAHCELAARNKGIYACNLGDTTNNWGGRLASLWAHQDTSAHTARKLVKWFFNDSGVPWFLWLIGNHDAMPGPVGRDALERFKPHGVVMEEWGARVTLRSPNGSEFRMHLAHDFPGHSQWNPLHGLQKAALMNDWAHLYGAGHKHNWMLSQNEHEHRGQIYWLARARGYKVLDDYGDRLGYGSQAHGHSILAVVDPGADGPGRITCFSDPQEGAEFLAFKRRRA
jgi:hypothetical protein